MHTTEHIDLNIFTSEHPEWSVVAGGTAIARTFTYSVYTDGIERLQAIIDLADELDHHPEITLGYQTCTVVLTTHDAGGVTERDARFAQLLDSSLAEA